MNPCKHFLIAILISFGTCSLCFLNIEELNELHYALDIKKFPVNEAEVDYTEGLKLSSKHGQSYFCKLPDTARKMAEQADPQESRLPTDYPVPMLLQPLKIDTCLKKVKGWWTYELCFGKSVRQYHSDDGITHGDAIDLGVFEADFDWNDEEKLKQSPFKQHKLQKYHSQTYVNGTKCDIHNHHRETEVRYYCDESANVAYIDRVDEPSTCSYIIIVKTSLLCSHPHTRLLSAAKAVDVVCQPMLTETKYLHYQQQEEKKSEERQQRMKERMVETQKMMKDYVQEVESSALTNNLFADMKTSVKPPKDLLQATEAESAEARETALDFISRLVEEKRLNKLSAESQKRLHKTITESVLRLRKLPSADMARLIQFEISAFLDAHELMSANSLFNTFHSLGMSALRDLGGFGNFGSDKNKEMEHVKVKVRHIDADVGEVNEENEQDPAIQQLEEEIGKELADAGYRSTERIEVHFITNTDKKESFSMTKDQAQLFKEMLLEVVGGISLEDNERRRYNRLIENYNLQFPGENEDMISTATEADETS